MWCSRAIAVMGLLAWTGSCTAPHRSSAEKWNDWADARFGPAPQGAMTVHRGSLAEAALEPAAFAPARSVLAGKKVALVLNGVESLREAVKPLQAAGVPIVVMQQAETAAADAAAVFDLDLRKPVAATSALNLIAELAGDEVGWALRDGVVWMTTRDKLALDVVLRTYDVRALVAPITDFIAPDLSGRKLAGLDEENTGRIGDSRPRHEEDAIVALIEDNIASDTWGANGTSISSHNGMLFVRHTPEVQAKVAQLLRMLGG